MLYFVKDGTGQRQVAYGLFCAIVRATNGANVPERWTNARGVECLTIRTIGVVSPLHAQAALERKRNRKKACRLRIKSKLDASLKADRCNVGKFLHIENVAGQAKRPVVPKWAAGKVATEKARIKAGTIK